MLTRLPLELRAAFRLARLALHLLRGMLVVRLFFPFAGPARRQKIKQAWARKLVAVLGVTLRQQQLDLPPACLIVCNHISWLDVFVINALTPTQFVCKDDVRAWPLIGWLVEATDTVFISRGSRAAAARTAETLVSRLARGERVVVFPEGTTTDGRSMLPFRPALFEAAVMARAPVAPLALRYGDAHDDISRGPAYDGDISFWQCLCAIVRCTGLYAEIKPLPVLTEPDRRRLAEQSAKAIAQTLGLSVPADASARPDLAQSLPAA